jgi:alkylation response protein AidB-like acyl-CoA dehydrogenase
MTPANSSSATSYPDDVALANDIQATAQVDSALPLEAVLAEIERRRDEFDRESHVPRDMIATMKRAGIFRASTPKQFGGDALPPAQFLAILERIAMVDGSAAWVAAFGSANTYLAALPVETQAQIYAGGPDQVFAGGLYPPQKAEPVTGGYQVSGRWKFASGCKGADWIGVGIGGAPAKPGEGVANRPFTAVFPANEVEIVDNWNVVGMQGTGSHDLRLDGKFVDARWTFHRGAPALIDEPLYRYPPVPYQAQVHSVINLGLARAALDLLNAQSGVARSMTSAPRLADRAYYRTNLAKAEAQWHAARAFFYDTAENAWRSLLAGDEVTPSQANLIRLAAVHAAQTGAAIVMQCYQSAGISSIYRDSRMQHLLRDSIVVTQHATLGDGTYDAAGALFVGVPPVTPYP